MPYDPTTGEFTRPSNSFSEPIQGTIIAPSDAIALFDAYDDALSNIQIKATGAANTRSLDAWAGDNTYIEDFGGGTDVADNTPAFNLALATAGVAGIRFRTGGSYTFASAPDIITRDFYIIGSQAPGVMTEVVRTYSEATPTRGLFSWTGGQAYVSNLKILSAGTAVTGGAAISIIPAVPPAAITLVSLNDLRITANGSGSSTWAYSIYMDGSALTSPLGLRTCYLKNVTVFGATTRACFIKSVVHFNWFGGSINSAGGVDGSLELTGTSAVTSQENNINLDAVEGGIILDWFTRSVISVGHLVGAVTNTSNTSHIVGRGWIQSGTIQNNWTASSWDSGDQYYLSTASAINWGGGDITINNTTNLLSFNGATVGGYTFDFTVYPALNDTAALGVSGQAWSDLFLASGGVINWNAGDVTITHSANTLAFAGAASGYTFDNTINGLTVNNSSASTAYTPVINSSGGTITTPGTCTGGWTRLNGKWVSFWAKIAITTNGTGSGRIEMTLPFTAANPAAPGCNNGNSGAGLSATIITTISTTKALIFTPAGAYPGADGWVAIVSGVYETT